MMNAHIKFIARTVFVKDNNIEEACRVINRSFFLNTVLKVELSGNIQQLFLSVVKNSKGWISKPTQFFYRIMGSEGWFDQFRRTRRYEKPYMVRRRVNFEKCKAIYNEDMKRKIQFVMKTNRVEPFPGC